MGANKTETGGPAFPGLEYLGAESKGEWRDKPYDGMTLRDYFAAKALQGIMQNDHVDGQGDDTRHAALAYRYADAMLAARSTEAR